MPKEQDKEVPIRMSLAADLELTTEQRVEIIEARLNDVVDRLDQVSAVLARGAEQSEL